MALDAPDEFPQSDVQPKQCKQCLAKFGYLVTPEGEWTKGFGPAFPSYPKLSIDVGGHEEKDGHTFYLIDCTVSRGGSAVGGHSWKTARRLCDIQVFSNAAAFLPDSYTDTFPYRGGLPGTTLDLNTWMQGVVESINAGSASALDVARTLQFLRGNTIDTPLVPFLKLSGFLALDADRWYEMPDSKKMPLPHLSLRVQSHEEKDGHTMYIVECALAPGKSPSGGGAGGEVKKWRAEHRLKQIREDWYERLGEMWPKFAEEVTEPFAGRGGLPGTSAALDAWVQGIAKVINERKMPPKAVAYSLQFLNIPLPQAAGVQLYAPRDGAPVNWTVDSTSKGGGYAGESTAFKRTS